MQASNEKLGKEDVDCVQVQGSQGKRAYGECMYVSTGRPEKESAVVCMCAERLRKESIGYVNMKARRLGKETCGVCECRKARERGHGVLLCVPAQGVTCILLV